MINAQPSVLNGLFSNVKCIHIGVEVIYLKLIIIFNIILFYT